MLSKLTVVTRARKWYMEHPNGSTHCVTSRDSNSDIITGVTHHVPSIRYRHHRHRHQYLWPPASAALVSSTTTVMSLAGMNSRGYIFIKRNKDCRGRQPGTGLCVWFSMLLKDRWTGNRGALTVANTAFNSEGCWGHFRTTPLPRNFLYILRRQRWISSGGSKLFL